MFVVFAAWQEVVQSQEEAQGAVRYQESSPSPDMDSEYCCSHNFFWSFIHVYMCEVEVTVDNKQTGDEILILLKDFIVTISNNRNMIKLERTYRGLSLRNLN